MTIKNNKICVEYERPFKPYPELTKANRVLLNNAAKKQNGWYHECLGSILLSAFRFEGLLNQLGYQTIPFWDEIERISWRKKFNILCEYFSISVDTNERPFHTIVELYSFRNEFVHPKPRVLKEKQVFKRKDIKSHQNEHITSLRKNKPLTKWERKCKLEFAERCYTDIWDVARILCKGADVDWDDFLIMTSSSLSGPFEIE